MKTKKQRKLKKDYLTKILTEINISYEILIFNSGEEFFNNYTQDVDIFLLDILMDKLNRMDIARKIREIDNKVEIIFITSLIEYVL